MEANVPISNPLPNKEIGIDAEKSEATKNTIGINKAKSMSLSLGREILPSPRDAMR